MQLNSLQHLFERNKKWAKSMTDKDPDFFVRLSKQQTPELLWIGCSDSRVPANQIIDLPPGEVFVHRNIANIVVHTDLNCLAVIEFAVDFLQVKHIIVTGHYGCGGVMAALEQREDNLIDNWLCHIRDVKRFNEDKLEGLDEASQLDLLCELNVREQVANVCNTSTVQSAWERGDVLTVHGWIYDIKNGILKELEPGITSVKQLENVQ